jgi:peptidoglycan hydrolase-like protein with peptidoglycan-binding domain
MKITINESQFKQILTFVSESDSERKLNVLFVGDSLSAGDGWTWNYLLAKDFPNWNVTHIVEPGKRTNWMLNNLSRELKRKKYDLVFIYGGTNDMFSNVGISDAVGNIQKMVDLVQKNGGKAYVFSGYDVESVMSDDVLKPTKKKNGTILCDQDCMLKSRDKLINFQSQLSNISNATVIPPVKGNPSWTSDGIHPSSSNHIIMKNHVKGFLDTKTTAPEVTADKQSSLFNKLFSVDNKKFGLSNQSTSLIDDLIQGLTNLRNSNKEFSFKGKVVVDDDVKLIQTALELLGFYLPNWGIDGKFGNETKTAVKQFQEKLSLEPTGVTDKNFIYYLIQQLKNKEFTDSDFGKIQIEKTASLPDSGEITSQPNISNKFEREALRKFGQPFVDKVKQISQEVGLKDYNILLAIMYFESGLNPAAQNKFTRATGLIQFMPFTAQSLGTSVSQLRGMTAIDQLDYVRKFFLNKGGLVSKVTSPEEAYLLVFYPAAVGKSDDYILGDTPKRQRLIAKQNKPFDSNNDGKVTKAEILNYVRKKWYGSLTV